MASKGITNAISPRKISSAPHEYDGALELSS